MSQRHLVSAQRPRYLATRRRAALLVFWLMCMGTAPARAQSVETIVQWHRLLIAALGVPGALPPTVFPTRPIAIMSVAVFDAVNTFDLPYRPYATRVEAPAGASRDAAAAQAAHDVLVALIPGQRATFDAALESALAALPAEAAREGAQVGAEVAAATLDLRAGDGWSRTPPVYVLPGLAGYWKPTPPANVSATFTHYPDVLGFIVPNGRRFLMEGPPSLTGARYAEDFNETRELGRVDSTTRTAEQTQTARLFAGVGTSTSAFAVWHNVIADTARARGLSGLDTARVFALANMATHDGFLTTFTGKFLYGLWRPVTAIREADRDGNDATAADPGWTPLLVTPPYPGHPGNMACHAATQAQALSRLFGQDNVPLQVTWTMAEGPAVVRGYNGFRQLADDAARSRVYGGIHFTFESLASIGVCNQLADYAVDNYLRRR